MMMKNCAGYFMLPLPVRKPIYIFPTAVFEIMAKKRSHLYLLKKSARDLTCPLKNRSPAGQTISDFQFLLLQGQQPPEMERIEMDFINRVLEKFQMNVTALNNYLKCPLEFYFKNLIRIPSPKNENTEFGSAVHFALEQLFRKMQENDKRVSRIQAFLLPLLTGIWTGTARVLRREQFRRRMEYGHIILPAYYEKYVHSWNTIVSIERNISNVAIEGVPAKGMLDKLEFDGKQVNVVDYKTGNPDNAIQKIKGPNEKQPAGWRLLATGCFLQIAC